MGHRPILFRTEKRRSRAVIAMLLSLAMVFELGLGEVLYALAEEANNVPVVYATNDSMKPTAGEKADEGKYPLTVSNLRVYALPAAGGPGVYPFLLIGAFAAAYALSGAGDRRNRLLFGKCRPRAAGPLGGD